MNDAPRKNTLEEQLEVVKAAFEGKNIESRGMDPTQMWGRSLAGNGTFVFSQLQYRVKREPAKLHVICEGDVPTHASRRSQVDAQDLCLSWNKASGGVKYNVREFVEVLK